MLYDDGTSRTPKANVKGDGGRVGEENDSFRKARARPNKNENNTLLILREHHFIFIPGVNKDCAEGREESNTSWKVLEIKHALACSLSHTHTRTRRLFNETANTAGG